MNYHNTKEGFPIGVHYGAIVFTSIYIPGDDRSRSSPGHGYPESTEHVCQYISFDNEGEMRNWVKEQREGTYQLIECKPLSVKLHVSVQVE
jgi:hypothetical protein